MTSTITIALDASSANIFREGPESLRREIQDLVENRLEIEQRQTEVRRQRAVAESLRLKQEIGEESTRRGLTEEILQELLRDES